MINGYNIELLEVQFKALKEPKTHSVQTTYIDNIDDIETTNDKVKIKYSRKVECVPSSLFQINVSFLVSFKKNKSQRDENLKKNIYEYPENYLNPAINMASNIIANLTLYVGSYPLVTSPSFKKP